MENSSITVGVVIATKDRGPLLERAILSVLRQTRAVDEICVVDDGSAPPVVLERFDGKAAMRILRNATSLGAGAARNRGLEALSADWAIILDDDDELLPTAVAEMAATLEPQVNFAGFPVIQFAHGNGNLLQEYVKVNLADYVNGTLRGDFLPVINRRVFLDAGLAYNEGRVVGEHLLWWRIAENYGIPTWSTRVGVVHSDAPNRLTSWRNQIAKAEGFAELQERTIREFGKRLERIAPDFLYKKKIGVAIYRLLSGDRKRSRAMLKEVWRGKGKLCTAALWTVTFLPLWCVRSLFSFFRTVSALRT